MATLDFDRLEQAGVSKNKVLDFVKAQDSNFNYQELQDFYKQQGFNEEESTRALYHDLRNFKGFDFNPNFTPQKISTQPQEANTQPAAKQDKTPTQELSPSEQAKADLDALKASQSPKPISPEELQEQAKQIGWHSVGDDLLSVVYENEAYKNKSAQLDGLLQKALASNTALKDLPENLKDYLNQKFREEEGGFFTFGDHASAQFAKEQQRQEILKAKDYNALSAQQKAFIDKEQGFLASAWDKIFKSDEERLQDYKEQTKARAVVKQMETSYALLSNIAEAKNFFSVFKAPDAKQQAAFRQSFSDLATGLGFDKVAFNEKGEPFVFKEGIAYKVNDGFMHNLKTYLAANAGSMVGALAGASYGARLPVSHPLAKIGASVAGAAVGSVLGAGVDVALSNAYLNRKNTASELAAHMLEAGALSVAGDALFLGAKAGFKALKPLVPSGDTLGKMSDYIPIVGTFKRARDGNAKAVEALISKTYTPEQRQALKEFGEAFGGQVKLQTPEQQSALRTKLENKFGTESGAIKAFDTLKDIFSLPSFAAKQEGYIQAIRADESGNLLAFLVQAANSSPQANLTLKSILNKTTKNLENELAQLRLNKGDIKALFDEMQQGTKESYQEMEDLIAKLYPSDTKTTLNSNRFKAMQEELKEQGLEEQAKPYMNFVSKNIYNPEGVSFKQLNNALKTLNGYYKSTADPHLKDFIKNLNDNALRTDIKQGIEDLLAKEPKFNEKLTEIYSTALKDYATMKDAHKLVKALKITDAAKSQDEAIDSVLKFVKGQGGSLAKGDKTDNLSALTKALSPENRQVLEMHMLARLFSKSLFEEADMRVFDSKDFFKRLNQLQEGKDGIFKSPAAQEFINLAKGFNRLFVNDALLARSIKPATSEKIGSSIATSIEGAVKYQLIKEAFSHLVRLAPYIPMATGFNEKVAGAALRYHLKSALSKSHTVSQFKTHLNAVVQKQPFDNKTKQLIREFLKGFDDDPPPPPPSGGDGGPAGPTPPTTPPKGDDGLTSNPPKGDMQGEDINALESTTRAHVVIEDKEAFIKNLDLSVNATPIPKELDLEGFLKSLEGVKNHENFIKHLQDKGNATERLAYLNLVEPTLKTPDIELFFKNPEKKEYIKAFKKKDGENLIYLLVTKDADTLLITGIPDIHQRYLRSQIRDADIIHSFIRPNGTDPKGSSRPHLDSTTSPLLADLSPEIKELIDNSPAKGRDMAIIGRENFTPAVVDYLLQFEGGSKKIAIELLEESKAQEWGFKHPTDVRRTIDKSEIIHVLERHGENGTITQARQQPPVTKADIAQYPRYSDEADIKVLGRNDAGEVVISGKQINGHYVVVEQIRKGQNELAFKTMYFERGDLRKNPIFDSAVQEHPKHPSYELGLGRKSDTKMELDSTTTPLLADLSTQEIKQAVKKWDLTNPKPTDSLDFALVKDPELTELQEVFNTDKLIRQIRSAEVKDTLDKGFSLKEVLDYTSHLPTAQRNILGDELHYTKPLENGKTLNIVEIYKAPKTLRFSRMDVVEDRGVATAQRQIDNPTPPKGDNPPPKGNEPQNPKTDITGETPVKTPETDTPKTEMEDTPTSDLAGRGTKADNAKKELDKIDPSTLNTEQQEVLKVFKGEMPSTTLQGKDLQELYTLETGSRKVGARKILIKHFGTEKTGGLNSAELLNMGFVLRHGAIDATSFELRGDALRYAYVLKEQDGVTLRVVVDEFNDGRKIFDFYSDRNFTDYQGGYSPKLPTAGNDSTTSPLLADLSPQEMKQAVKKWDLTNPKPTDSLDFALVKDPELTELQEVFNTDKLIRQIRSAEVKDTLDKGFSLKEVLDYTSHLPTAQRNILGDELHYTKPLENGKTLNIVEIYKAPKTLRFSRMDVVEDRGVATAQRQIDNPTPPKGDNPPPKGNEPQNPKTDITGETPVKTPETDTPKTEMEDTPTSDLAGRGTKADNAKKELDKIDPSTLNTEQQEVLKVFKGEMPSTTLQGKDLQELYTLETGSRKVGARKILIKHFGTEKTGGLNSAELLNMGFVLRHGAIDATSFELRGDALRYAYVLKEQDGVTLRVVVDEFNDGRKIFDFYSDRNFTDYQGGYSPKLPTAGNDSTTSPLLADLSPQEMKQAVKKWDLTNPKPTDSLDFALVKDPELTELQEVFNTDKLIRQLRSAEVKDTLDKGFSLKEVLDYTSHLPTAQRNILGDELHYTKPLENGKTLNIVETYKAPKTLRFSRMDVVEDRGVATAQRQIDNPTPPKGDNPPPKGNEPQNPTSGLEQAWLETFGLKSLDEPFIPQFSKEVQAVLEPILQGEQIQLTQGSLIKLEKRQREEFLPLIRPTLEEPNAVLDDGKGLLFIKEFIDPDKNRYFMSVAKNYDGEWVFSSHVRKDFSGIKKKFADSKVLYNAGFKGGEVAGASDILESGGTAVKPSDLQIDTPPNRGSGLNPTGKDTTHPLKIEPNPEFGENFAEYAGKGAEAVKKLLQEKRGQVSGAFYRQDLGYIDLVWGSVEGKGKEAKGLGLSKIVEKHIEDFSPFEGNTPLEKLASGLNEIINKGEFKAQENTSATIKYTKDGNLFRVGLRQNWMGEPTKNKWVITAYKDEREASKIIDSKGFTGGETLPPNPKADSTTTPLKKQTTAQGKNYLKSLSPEELKKAEDETYQDLSLLATKPLSTTPLTKEQLFKELKGYKHFGHDFTEFRDKGLEALELIAKKKHGQVSGAYYRADLGAIDIGYQLPLSNNTQRGLVDLLAGRGASDTQTNIYYWGKPALAPFAGNTDKEKILRAVDKIIKEGTYSLEEGHHMLNLELDNGIYQLELFPLSLKQPSHFYPMSIQYHHKPKNPNSPMERE